MIKIHVRGFRIIVMEEELLLLVLLQLEAMHTYKALLWGKNIIPSTVSMEPLNKGENFPLSLSVFYFD